MPQGAVGAVALINAGGPALCNYFAADTAASQGARCDVQAIVSRRCLHCGIVRSVAWRSVCIVACASQASKESRQLLLVVIVETKRLPCDCKATEAAT
jgi:hypothetical protein